MEAVLAHELGHFKHRHILKMMATSFTLSLAGLALLGWLPPWAAGLGMASSSLLVVGNSLRLAR